MDIPASEAYVRACGLTRLVHRVEVSSTMDVAHALAAEGAPAGTLVLADRQLQGRGRSGKSWESEGDAGVWCTLIERPDDLAALSVLSLRVGLALADVLDAFVAMPIGLKWPNDLFVGAGKLGGILIEVRWRGVRPEWVAIGVGVNRRPPTSAEAARMATASVRDDVSRQILLPPMARAMRAAARMVGPLTSAELDRWHQRDIVRGRLIQQPIAGRVLGLSADGALMVTTDGGVVHTLHSGSLQFS